MNFNSYNFFVFLGAVLLLHYSLPWRYGRWTLLIASYIFYGAAKPWYCLLLFTSTLINFFVGRAIPSAGTLQNKKRLLIFAVLINLGLLGLFKYSDFVIGNLNVFSGWFGFEALPALNWVLPVGISFYTFQALSYSIDVYRGKIYPTRDFISFALFVAYFPQLVAGPIERSDHLLPQLSCKQKVSAQDFTEGFQRILWGLAKKLVLADRLALMVNEVYGRPALESSPVLMIATVAFAFQIYLDFSAYTDIALGAARLMGVRLRENFNWPYLARNPVDFWSRWHMTLTAWFRDYVFTPLGGIKPHRPRKSFFNLVFVMTLVGFWHGASWNFIIFGFISGIYIAVYQVMRIKRARQKARPSRGGSRWLAPLVITAAFIQINVIMVFFRSADLHTARQVFLGFFKNGWHWLPQYNIQLFMVGFLWLIHLTKAVFFNGYKQTSAVPAILRAAFWVLLILCITYGAVENTEKFIYFRF